MAKTKDKLVANGERPKIVNFNRLEHRDIKGNKVPYAVELVSACVKFYRNPKHARPIKTVYLNTILYEQLKDWARRMAGERVADLLQGNKQREQVLTFDSVAVMKASVLTLDPISWDFYEEPNRGNA